MALCCALLVGCSAPSLTGVDSTGRQFTLNLTDDSGLVADVAEDRGPWEASEPIPSAPALDERTGRVRCFRTVATTISMCRPFERTGL